jgi:hypothetical protein
MKPHTIATIRATLRAEFARMGGKTKSAKKSAAARENGKRGGRPKKEKIIVDNLTS